VDATDQPPQPEYDDGSPDSPFSRVDTGYVQLADGFAPFSVCSQCACGSSSLCFAGGRGYGAFSGTCAATAPGATPAIGCVPIPAACANEPDCPCLLNALSPVLPCYTVCADNGGFVVYCP
jgi:hypothetical protein